jgi:hypothetical protein
MSQRKLIWRIGLDKAAFIVWTNPRVWCFELKSFNYLVDQVQSLKAESVVTICIYWSKYTVS